MLITAIFMFLTMFSLAFFSDFSNIAAASTPIHSFLQFFYPVLHTIFFLIQAVGLSFLPEGCQNMGLLGKELTLSQTSPGFYVSAVQVF